MFAVAFHLMVLLAPSCTRKIDASHSLLALMGTGPHLCCVAPANLAPELLGLAIPMNPLSNIQQLGRFRAYKANQRIYARGCPAENVFIVRSGEAIAVSTAVDGREVLFYRMDNTYGLTPLTALLGGVEYQHDCMARTDCELLAIRTDEARRMIHSDPVASAHVLNLALRLLLSAGASIGGFYRRKAYCTASDPS
jgi:hypothetical protein